MNEKRRDSTTQHAHADSHFLADRARGVSAGERRARERGKGEEATREMGKILLYVQLLLSCRYRRRRGSNNRWY